MGKPQLNKVMLIGNLTGDPKLESLPNGRPFVAFGLATNRKFKRADGTEGEDVLFVDVTFFGPVAEVIHKWVHKGDPLYVEGRLRLEKWQNDKGEPRTKIAVTGEHFQFIPRKQEVTK